MEILAKENIKNTPYKMVSRTKQLANFVVKYCINVKPKQTVIISGSSEAEKFIGSLYKSLILAKANPLIRMHPKNIDWFYFKYANKNQLKHFPKYWYDEVKKADAYIEICTEYNTRGLSLTDPKKVALREEAIGPIADYVLNQKGRLKYVEVAYPCLSHAIEAEMSLEEWEEFVFSSCLVNWKKRTKRFQKIAKRFHRGKEVHLIGKNVDLKFSIKDKNAIVDDGQENLPGGEIYMAPIKKTLNGFIKFDYPSFYNGREIKDIYLKFKNGKVIEYGASKNKSTLKVALESDKNASYVGEFGIGINPTIQRFSHNLLFDEKMNGTVHLALGMAYLENGGGNDSVIHWDLIKDMKNAKIILDGKVVQENGKWKI